MFPQWILLWAETSQSFKGQNLKLKPTFNPCQGRLPRRKYMNIWPRASKSSRRLCSKREEMTNYCCRSRNGSDISAAATPVSEIKVPQGHSLTVCSSDLVQNQKLFQKVRKCVKSARSHEITWELHNTHPNLRQNRQLLIAEE